MSYSMGVVIAVQRPLLEKDDDLKPTIVLTPIVVKVGWLGWFA